MIPFQYENVNCKFAMSLGILKRFQTNNFCRVGNTVEYFCARIKPVF